MLMRTIIGILAVFAAGAVMAQAYRWVDDNGVVHFSDRPVEGAERIVLPSDGTRPRAQQPAPTFAATTTPTAEPPPEVFQYESIEIVAPAPEETLWNIEGVLNVSLALNPPLQPGHQVRVYFDGNPQMVSGTSFQLNEVWRGVHNLQAEIIDETGRTMIRSRTNRFYVQQNTVR